MKNTFYAEPFTNSLGQVIHPGDRVGYVSHSTQTVHLGRGTYAGVIRDAAGRHVGTRVTGIRTMKSFPTGRMRTVESSKYDYTLGKYVPYTWQYEERENRPVEPYGSTCLQRHRVFKLAD